MNLSELWNELRQNGVDADDPEIRASVRATLATVDDVRRREGGHVARRCSEAMHQALSYTLSHPDTGDMSVFEEEFDEDAS
jgi:hypothetical protein